MRIGINLLYLLPGVSGGTETYATALLHGLASYASDLEFLVFTNAESRAWPIPLDRRFRRIQCPVRATDRPARYGYEQMVLPRIARKQGVHLLHSLGYVAPIFSRLPSVVTVHDVNFIALRRYLSLRRRLALRVFVSFAVRRADRVITISHYSKAQLSECFGLRDDRCRVVHAASARQLHADSWPASPDRRGPAALRPYVLAFCGRSAHKNTERLVRAFQHYCRHLPHRLVLVGGPQIRAATGPNVLLLGHLCDLDLAEVLRGAELLAMPSLYEGFGLPLIEAQAAGVPVVCSEIGALKEIGADSVMFFDPLDERTIGLVMARALEDQELRQDLIHRGRHNAGKYSPQRMAVETESVYRELLSKGSKNERREAS